MNLNTGLKLDGAKKRLKQGLGDMPALQEMSDGHSIEPLSNSKSPLSQKKLNRGIWNDAVKRARGDARLTFWSPQGKIVMEYLAGTTARYSKSEQIKAVFDAWLQQNYPTLWEAAGSEVNSEK
jgi:hypothetical protein